RVERTVGGQRARDQWPPARGRHGVPRPFPGRADHSDSRGLRERHGVDVASASPGVVGLTSPARRRPRTWGDASAPSATTMYTNPPARATSRAPNTEASGPTRSWPTGIATNDPNASYDQSRDSSSLGTFSCIAVVQPMPNTSPPVPARNIRTTRGMVDGATPRANIGNARAPMPIIPARSG